MIICAQNRFDDATLFEGPEDSYFADFVADLYGLPGTGPLPVSNLKTQLVSEVWRSLSDDPAWTWFRADFGVARLIDVVALINHNITSAGKWRVRLSNDHNFSTTTYDSGLIDAWPSIGGYGALPWGVFQWGDIISTQDAAYFKISSYCILPENITGRYLRIDISDANNPAGYIQAGRCWAAPAWRPSLDMQYGWSIGWVDPSEVSKSRGGQASIKVLPKYRVLSFELADIPEAEMYPNAFDYIDRRKGISGDILVIPQPSKPELFIHEAIYGRMQSLAPVSNPYFERRSKPFIVEELI